MCVQKQKTDAGTHPEKATRPMQCDVSEYVSKESIFHTAMTKKVNKLLHLSDGNGFIGNN